MHLLLGWDKVSGLGKMRFSQPPRLLMLLLSNAARITFSCGQQLKRTIKRALYMLQILPIQTEIAN